MTDCGMRMVGARAGWRPVKAADAAVNVEARKRAIRVFRSAKSNDAVNDSVVHDIWVGRIDACKDDIFAEEVDMFAV